MDKNQIIKEIKKLKKDKNAIVLTHCYQNVEIDEVSDYVGDSLYLSRVASETDASVIVFSGVYFMAETAKILSPNKKVLLPNLDCGCQMADMITLSKIKEFKEKYKNIPVVCYVNSPAVVKAEADVCCTSANAVSVVKSLNQKKVLFVPDKFLGSYVQSQLKDVEVICFDGFCPVHGEIKADDILKIKNMHKNAEVLIHPECNSEVVKLADFVGSTTFIMKYAKESPKDEFIIVTEKGVLDRLKRDLPNKKFYSTDNNIICPSMKMTSLVDILESLKEEKYEIFVEDDVQIRALSAIQKMIK